MGQRRGRGQEGRRKRERRWRWGGGEAGQKGVILRVRGGRSEKAKDKSGQRVGREEGRRSNEKLQGKRADRWVGSEGLGGGGGR